MPLDLLDTTALTPPSPHRDINQELGDSFLSYAMSVIVSRALPDARDGLKPVHRRILWSMDQEKASADKAHRKSARVVGDVMGKYHPHGDSAIYDAMVRMAQPFSLRVPLIDGQGNFGSIDGDGAAAMRYTEARLARPAELVLADIEEILEADEDEEIKLFVPNYDGSQREPMVLPTRIPNLLIGGSQGIAVGMATNMPPHNPIEAIDAAIAVIRAPNIGLEDLMRIIPGPDFPTGATASGRAAIRQAYETGRGSILVRGTAAIEQVSEGKRKTKTDRKAIVITELPYQVNKAKLAEKIAELAEPIQNGQTKQPPPIEGIADVRDESDREGMRLVVELKKDADPDAVLASLYRMTELQTSFSYNAVAIDWTSGGPKPETLSLKRMLEIFVEHRRDIIRRRSRYRLKKARGKLHLQAGLLAALDSIDSVVTTIRNSASTPAAREALQGLRFPITGLLAEIIDLDPTSHDQKVGEARDQFRLSELQANYILEMQLRRLTNQDSEAVAEEVRGLAATIQDLLGILNDRARADEVMLEELDQAKASFKGDLPTRRTKIDEIGPEPVDDLATIPRENVLVTFTTSGNVKRTPVNGFKTQKRGGVGKSGAKTEESEAITHSFACTTHAQLLVFTAEGMCYAVPVYRLPNAGPRDKGRAIQNFCEHLQAKTISAVLVREPDASEADSLVFVFSNGDIRRNASSDFASVKSNGKIAAKFEEGDTTTKLVSVLYARETEDDVMIFTSHGQAIRFQVTEDDLRVMATRGSTGVRGIRLGMNDAVVGAAVVPHGKATPEERDAWTSGKEAEIAKLPDERRAELAETERFVLTVSEKGFGKRSSTHHFRITSRGGKGITAAKLSTETGTLVVALPIDDRADLLIGTSEAQVIRIKAAETPVQSRDTRGNRLMRLSGKDTIRSVMRLEPQEEDMEPETGDLLSGGN